MSRSSKQRFIDEVNALLQSISVTPEASRILVSQPLYEAIVEIAAEVNTPRTNWALVTALTGVKSYVCGARPENESEHRFWEAQSSDTGRNVYRTLDSLHFRAAMRVNVLPSGLSVFGRTAEGIGVQHGEVDTTASPGSPTLRMIAEERARIERAATDG